MLLSNLSLSLKTWSSLCFPPVTNKNIKKKNNKNNPHQILQLLLTKFWPNFKGNFMGTSRTDANCYGEICPGNICPSNICLYQQYLRCFWSNFDQAFWTQFSRGPKKFFEPKIFLDSNFVQTLIFFQTQIFFFGPYIFSKKFRTKIYSAPKVFEPTISLEVFRSKMFCGPKFSSDPWFFLDPIFVW